MASHYSRPVGLGCFEKEGVLLPGPIPQIGWSQTRKHRLQGYSGALSESRLEDFSKQALRVLLSNLRHLVRPIVRAVSDLPPERSQTAWPALSHRSDHPLFAPVQRQDLHPSRRAPIA